MSISFCEYEHTKLTLILFPRTLISPKMTYQLVSTFSLCRLIQPRNNAISVRNCQKIFLLLIYLLGIKYRRKRKERKQTKQIQLFCDKQPTKDFRIYHPLGGHTFFFFFSLLNFETHQPIFSFLRILQI